MKEFRELGVPEVEVGISIHAGKWFVFIDNSTDAKYVNDDLHFLHNNGREMCKLRKDTENGRIMFDTELDAFTKSIEFYALHSKIYPWGEAYGNCLTAKYIGTPAADFESQTMRFD